MKKATIEILLERKRNQDKNTTVNIDVKSVDLSFTVVKLPLEQMVNIMDRYNVESGIKMSENFGMLKELIYISVPMFKDKALLDAYEVAEPFDVVSAVFNDNLMGIAELGNAILDIYGLNNGTAVNNLKN